MQIDQPVSFEEATQLVKGRNKIDSRTRDLIMQRIGGEQSPEFYRGLLSGYLSSFTLASIMSEMSAQATIVLADWMFKKGYIIDPSYIPNTQTSPNDQEAYSNGTLEDVAISLGEMFGFSPEQVQKIVAGDSNLTESYEQATGQSVSTFGRGHDIDNSIEELLETLGMGNPVKRQREQLEEALLSSINLMVVNPEISGHQHLQDHVRSCLACADKIGVTEDEMMKSLAASPRSVIEAYANKFGVLVNDVKEAFGIV